MAVILGWSGSEGLLGSGNTEEEEDDFSKYSSPHTFVNKHRLLDKDPRTCEAYFA
jgi:hypothetical protein